jgi:hypothetical protein
MKNKKNKKKLHVTKQLKNCSVFDSSIIESNMASRLQFQFFT